MKFIETENKIKDDKIFQEVENILGFKLPEIYKTFLKEHHGGRIENKDSMNHEKLGWISTGRFADLVKGSYNYLPKDYESLIYNFPELTGYIPFAIDDLGNYFLINTNNGEKIYFLDTETGELAKLAESLIAFLNKLKEFEAW